MKKLLIYLLIFCSVIALSACTLREEKEVEYIKITPQEAQKMMQSDDVIILDVRTQEEFEAGHIPNAVLLPDFEVQENAKYVIPDKEQIILVYCLRGIRSENASRALIEMGYTRIYDFGGIMDWDGEIVTR